MSFGKEQGPASPERGNLPELANELNAIQMKKTGGKGDIVMQKLIQRLRNNDGDSARIFLHNESDKFSQYRDDAIPLIIEKLYGGSGSPWFTLEK